MDIDGDAGLVDGAGIAGLKVGEGDMFVVRLSIPWQPFQVLTIVRNVRVVGVMGSLSPQLKTVCQVD